MQQKTTNFCEGWHNAFDFTIHSSPTVNKFVYQLLAEQNHTEVLKSQLFSGDKYEQKPAEYSKLQRLWRVVVSYSSKSILDYLNNITGALDNVEAYHKIQENKNLDN